MKRVVDEDGEAEYEDKHHQPVIVKSLNTWVVAVVSSGVIALSAFLATESFRDMQTKLSEHQSRIQALEIQSATLRESQRRIDETLLRLEQNDMRVLEQLQRLNNREEIRRR